jgi:hypothetical protein
MKLSTNVLDRRAGLDETQQHAGSRRLGEQGAAGDFGTLSITISVSTGDLDEQAYDLRATDGWSVAAAAIAFEIGPRTVRKCLPASAARRRRPAKTAARRRTGRQQA